MSDTKKAAEAQEQRRRGSNVSIAQQGEAMSKESAKTGVEDTCVGGGCIPPTSCSACVPEVQVQRDEVIEAMKDLLARIDSEPSMDGHLRSIHIRRDHGDSRQTSDALRAAMAAVARLSATDLPKVPRPSGVGTTEEILTAAKEARALEVEELFALRAVVRRWRRLMDAAGAARCSCNPSESYVCCRCEVDVVLEMSSADRLRASPWGELASARERQPGEGPADARARERPPRGHVVSAPVLWWVSWEEHESPDDSRPIHDPPNPAVLAWWKSGEAGDGSFATMVALVNAPDEAAIAKAIKTDWPTKKPRVWRFQNERNERPLVIGDRFPFAPWSIERLKALGVAHDVTPRKERR